MSIAGPLDKDLPVPLYHQLMGLLKAEIEAGKWRPDEQLPSETKLAELYQVSKITLRQALEKLAELGYIRREHGRGTFVERRKFDEGPRELTSFTEEMRRHELVAASRVLSQRVAEADAKVADALGLPEKSLVFELKRLRLASGEPVSVQTAYLPAAFVPGLVVTEEASLYEVLQRQYHLYAARARETYIAAAADASAARLLGIPTGAPVFSVERVTLLPIEKPFEFVQSVVRGDRYSIVLDLVKHDGGQRALALRQPGRKRKLIPSRP
ncbi:MAG TPA: GntR family transcriptional regulator [Candidatus Sulfopaludibacter sp.]|jgi:GntR family transcriptional regulator|nr:GntR family transcriptional regulator [Candidatus Sulfopaludibacter sp.]